MYNNYNATLTVPSLTLPILESPRVTIPRLTIPTLPRVSYPKIKNTRHVVDLGDLLLGNPISGTRQLQETLRDNDLAKLVYVPILNRIVGTGLMLKERAVEPILKGEFGTFGINTLETLGHSADLLSNPVKSLMPWAHGGTSNDFLKSMGWLDGAYREQYEWDTGNFLVDLIGEIFSDPATLVSFGAKTGTKAMDKAGSRISQEIQEEFTEQLTKKLGKEVVDDDAIKAIIKQLTPAQLADVTDDLTKENSAIIRYISNNLETQRLNYKAAMEDAAIGSEAYKKAKALYKKYNKAFLNAEQVNIDITSIRQSKLYNTYSTLKNVQKGADNVQNIIQEAGMYVSGLKPAQLAYQKIITPTFRALYNNYLKTLNKVDPYDLVGRPGEVSKYLKQTIAAKNEAMYKYTYDILRDRIKYVLKTNDKETTAIIKKLREIAVDVFGNPKYANNSTKALRIMFIERVKQMYPELAGIFNKSLATDYQALLAQQTKKISKVAKAAQKETDKFLNELTEQTLIDELAPLLDAFESYGLLVNASKDKITAEFKAFVEKQMNNFFNKKGPYKPLNQFHPIEKIKYVNEILPAFNTVVNPNATKKITIADLDLDFLTKLQNIDEEAYLKLTALLDYLGININNKAEIDGYIKAFTKNKEAIANYATQAANGSGSFDKKIKALNKEQDRITNELKNIMKAARKGDIYVNLDNAASALQNQSANIDLSAIINYGLQVDDDAFLKEVTKGATKRMKKIQHTSEKLVTALKDLKNNYTEEQLERLYEYMDTYLVNNADDIVPSTYIKNLFNVLDTINDLDNLNIDNKTILENLRERINLWVSSIDKQHIATLEHEEKIINSEVSNFLNAFKGVLDDKNTIEYIANLDELLDRTIYVPVLGAQERIRLVLAALEGPSGLNPEFLKAILNKDSNLRTALEATKNQLQIVASQTNDSEYEHLAKCIEHLTNKFDTIAIMKEYLDTTPLIQGLDLSKNVKETLQGYLINAIYDSRISFKRVNQLTDSDIESIYKHIIRDIKRTRYLELTDKYNLKSVRTKLGDTFDLFIELEDLERNISNLTDNELDYLDELKTLLADYEADWQLFKQYTTEYNNLDDTEELFAKIHEKIYRYIKSLQELDNINNLTDIKVFNFFDAEDIKLANNLGQEYDNIFNILKSKEYTDNFKAEVSSFVLNMAGSRTVISEDSILNDYLIQLRDTGKLSEEAIENYLASLETTSLAGLLSYTFTNQIGATNISRLGDDALLKKLYPGGKSIKVKNILNFVTAQELNEVIRRTTTLHNVYEFSSANGKVAFKKIKLLSSTKLRMADLVFTNETQKNAYVMGFSELYNNTINMQSVNKYSADYIKQIRETLKDYYKKNTLDAMPRDPIRFFNSLDKEDIIAWHRYTSSLYVGYRNAYTEDLHLRFAAFNARIVEDSKEYKAALLQRKRDVKAKDIETMQARYQKLIDDAADEEIVTDTLVNLDATTSSKLQFDSTDIDNIVTSKAANISELYDQMQATFETVIKRNFKSLDSIYDASDILTRKTKEDITAMERNRLFKNLLADDRTIEEAYPDLSQRDIKVLKSWGIDYHTTRMNNKRLMQLVKHNMEHNVYNSIMRFKPTELRAFIDHNTDGILLFYDPTSMFLKNYTRKELQEAGLFVKELKGTNSGFYFIRRTDNKMHNALLSFDISKDQIPVIQDITNKINKLMYKNEYYFTLDNMYMPLENFSGDMLRKSTLDLLLNTKELSELVGDLEVQKSYRKIDNLGQNLFHVREIYRPNMTILGYEDATNAFLNRFRRGIDAQKLKYARTSTAIDKTAWQGTTQAINAWNTEHKYLQLFFNKDFAIDSPAFRKAFERATDADIKKFFARNNWDACILRYNRAGRPTVYKISIENKKQLEEAIKLGAVCLPHEAYRNVVLTVNKHLCTSKLVNAYQTVIAATFKIIYLTNPGFFMRNYLDSAIYKNLSSTGGLTSIVDNFKYQIQAHQLLEHYNKIVEKMTADGVFNTRSIKRVLAQLSEDDKKMYLFMDRYMATGAGGGQIKALQDFLLNYNKAHGNTAPTYLWAEKYRERVLGNPMTAGINYINNDIEQTARLALFLNLMDNEGGDFTKSIKTVIDTHFDYELRTPGLERLDQFFWFSTFPINNLFYYMNEGLTKNPEMFNMQLDLMELSWNNKTDYTWDDVRNSKYLTYNALAGNIRFKIAGNNIVLKTGASVFDFLNILMNPIGEAKERLNPFLATALGFESPKELNPLQTPINRVNQIISGQSYLPSVYATLYPKYGRKIYPNKERRYSSSWRIKTKKIPIRKSSTISKQMRKRAYNFYTKRYYMKKWRPKLNRSISIEPYYNPVEGRTAGAYARYTRQMKKVGQNKKRH